MSVTASLIAEARKHLGVAEATGRNDGEPIESWQREAARTFGKPDSYYAGAPWCAIFQLHVHQTVDPRGFEPVYCHPFTGYMCRAAQATGIMSDAPRPGAIIVKCGIHTGLVVNVRGSLVDTIEGNQGNAVRTVVRNANDWRYIVGPWVDDLTPPVERVYGFDDLTLKPVTYGPWMTAAIRDEQMARFRATRDLTGLWGPVAVLLDKADPRYAFRVGPEGTYGVTWRFGPWQTKKARDRVMNARAANTGHAMRPWSRRV